MTDWVAWHARYDRDTPLSRRLEVVQGQLRELLDRQQDGEIRVVSVCAGQGRDLLPVAAAHPRRADIRARLVELDPHNTRVAEKTAASLGLSRIEIVTGDASLTRQYEGAVPADIVIACGIFGNISDEDIQSTIEHLPELCGRRAVVVWTRGGRNPDLRPSVRRWFGEHGFEELFFRGEPDDFGVGVHRLVAEPKPFEPGRKLFTFVR